MNELTRVQLEKELREAKEQSAQQLRDFQSRFLKLSAAYNELLEEHQLTLQKAELYITETKAKNLFFELRKKTLISEINAAIAKIRRIR